VSVAHSSLGAHPQRTPKTPGGSTGLSLTSALHLPQHRAHVPSRDLTELTRCADDLAGWAPHPRVPIETAPTVPKPSSSGRRRLSDTRHSVWRLVGTGGRKRHDRHAAIYQATPRHSGGRPSRHFRLRSSSASNGASANKRGIRHPSSILVHRFHETDHSRVRRCPVTTSPCPAKAPYFPRSRKDMIRNSTMLNRERRQNGQGSPWPTDALRALSEMTTPPAKDVERSSGRGPTIAPWCEVTWQGIRGWAATSGLRVMGVLVRPIRTFTHRYHLLAIGSESRQPVTPDYMAH
jgi:hypothetical protein